MQSTRNMYYMVGACVGCINEHWIQMRAIDRVVLQLQSIDLYFPDRNTAERHVHIGLEWDRATAGLPHGHDYAQLGCSHSF